MKVLVYWHDIFLPYSDYLIRAFAADSRISELCIVGPKEYEAEAIYAGSENAQSFTSHVTFKKIETYSFRKKWGPISEFKKCIHTFLPDCIIVLDEAFSINTLNIGIANMLTGNRAKVLFYGFENIYQTPPFQFLFQNPSFQNLFIFLRKSARYFFIDFLLQPIRAQVVHGGLACYWESLQVVHQFGWRPKLKPQWWGLDLAPFQKAAQAPRDLASAGLEPLDPEARIIGYVGRLIQEKGVFDLLEMMRRLDHHYHLVLVGSGPEESALKQEAGEPDLINKVTFLPPQSRDELAKLYRLFDVLVLPSKTDYFWKEQYGRVLVEAMACGTPVMGSRSGAIPAVIDRAECCFPEGDIGQMVQIVQSLTSLEEEKQSLQNRSELGSAQHFVSAYLNLYAELKGAVS